MYFEHVCWISQQQFRLWLWRKHCLEVTVTPVYREPGVVLNIPTTFSVLNSLHLQSRSARLNWSQYQQHPSFELSSTHYNHLTIFNIFWPYSIFQVTYILQHYSQHSCFIPAVFSNQTSIPNNPCKLSSAFHIQATKLDVPPYFRSTWQLCWAFWLSASFHLFSKLTAFKRSIFWLSSMFQITFTL